jgi:hypothetical protein
MINLDFADVRTVMESKGLAHMGIGTARGENRMIEAAEDAIQSPMLETSIDGARSVLINITGSQDMTLFEVNKAAQRIQQAADPEANIIFGAGIDDTLADEVRITVIATGFEKPAAPQREEGFTALRRPRTVEGENKPRTGLQQPLMGDEDVRRVRKIPRPVPAGENRPAQRPAAPRPGSSTMPQPRRPLQNTHVPEKKVPRPQTAAPKREARRGFQADSVNFSLDDE